MSKVPKEEFHRFMRDDDVDENVTVINYKEKHTKAFGAHVVKKGLDAGVAERIIMHIERCGCKDELLVKTDQEPWIQAVAEDIRKLVSGETTIEASKKPTRCQDPGTIKNFVMWLAEYAADILNKFAPGIDGKTAYERIKGKKAPW